MFSRSWQQGVVCPSLQRVCSCDASGHAAPATWLAEQPQPQTQRIVAQFVANRCFCHPQFVTEFFKEFLACDTLEVGCCARCARCARCACSGLTGCLQHNACMLLACPGQVPTFQRLPPLPRPPTTPPSSRSFDLLI